MLQNPTVTLHIQLSMKVVYWYVNIWMTIHKTEQQPETSAIFIFFHMDRFAYSFHEVYFLPAAQRLQQRDEGRGPLVPSPTILAMSNTFPAMTLRGFTTATTTLGSASPKAWINAASNAAASTSARPIWELVWAVFLCYFQQQLYI